MSVPDFMDNRHFTQSHTFEPHAGARGKVRGSLKSLGFILREP